MPKQAHRSNKYPFDGKNRAALIIDGDNVRSTGKHYGILYPFDDTADWVQTPSNLGIDKLISTCVFFTLPYAKTRDRRLLPLADRRRFCEHLYVRPPNQAGYHDNEMYREAIRLAPRLDTLVLMSSDGGKDGGIYRFAAELREGYNRFTGYYDSSLICEVVCISSHLDANANWPVQAINSVALEDMFPELRHRLRQLRPFSALTA